MTHTTIEREALQTVLDTLEENHHLIEQYERSEYLALYDRQITVIKQALAAPVQDTDAHYKGVVEGVQKLFDDKRAQPAVPDAIGPNEDELPAYAAGWNDCRQAMLEMMK
jgi:hypothetical protein